MEGQNVQRGGGREISIVFLGSAPQVRLNVLATREPQAPPCGLANLCSAEL